MQDESDKTTEFDVLTKHVLAIPNEREATVQHGMTCRFVSGQDSFDFYDVADKPAIRIAKDAPCSQALIALEGKRCKVRCLEKRSWRKYLGRPYYRFSVEIIEPSPSVNRRSLQVPVIKQTSTSAPRVSDAKDKAPAQRSDSLQPTKPGDFSSKGSPAVPNKPEATKSCMNPSSSTPPPAKTKPKPYNRVEPKPPTPVTSTVKKQTSSPKPKARKRGSGDFYQDSYSFDITLLWTKNQKEAESFNGVKGKDIRIKLGNGAAGFRDAFLVIEGNKVKKITDCYRDGDSIVELLDAGYTASFSNPVIEEDRRLVNRWFDKDSYREWTTYETNYYVKTTITLKKPETLKGLEVQPDAASSKSVKNYRGLHESVVEACSAASLQPREATAAEFTLLGLSKADIAKQMSWTVEGTKEILDSCYKKLKVRSKAELKEALSLIAGRGKERVEFRFDIAGTYYHDDSSKLLKTTASRLRAVRKPDNAHDPNAVAICIGNKQVGWVPKKTARDVARLMDAGYSTVFEELEVSTYHTGYLHEDKYGNLEHETGMLAEVLLVCMKPKIEAQTTPEAVQAPKKKAPKIKELEAKDIISAVNALRKQKGLTPNESEVLEGIAGGLSRSEIADKLGWTINKVKDNSKSAYRKLGVHSKEELIEMLEAQLSKRTGSQTKTKYEDRAKQVSKNPKPTKLKKEKRYVDVADFIVRSHGFSCKHKNHEMTPVEASVMVMIGNSTLTERSFAAFYCEQCDKYFVTNDAFERLTRSGRLCCRIIELEEITNPKTGKGVWANFADESLIHQYGYNVNKEDDLSSAERQAILSFIIENKIMSQYEIISFLEGLIGTREGMRNMQNATAKWREDIRFLEHYRPPSKSLKVNAIYARKSRVR